MAATCAIAHFFLIDRLKLTGFDPGNAGQFHQAVVYSNRIQ